MWRAGQTTKPGGSARRRWRRGRFATGLVACPISIPGLKWFFNVFVHRVFSIDLWWFMHEKMSIMFFLLIFHLGFYRFHSISHSYPTKKSHHHPMIVPWPGNRFHVSKALMVATYILMVEIPRNRTNGQFGHGEKKSVDSIATLHLRSSEILWSGSGGVQAGEYDIYIYIMYLYILYNGGIPK